MRKLRPLLWLILIFFLPSSNLSAQGVVVEAVAEASAPEKAGVREGDVFHAWTRLANPPLHPEPASGMLQSPFDWQWMEIEQAPRGTVELRGERQGEATAELMQRFYRYLRAGKAKDEALRAAQLELIRRPLRVPNGRGGWTERNAAAPYFWAALQLVGDSQ